MLSRLPRSRGCPILAVMGLTACSAGQPGPHGFVPAEWPLFAAVRPVTGATAMVVSGSPLASQVGAEVLRGGGNAVDAAVAVGFALTVVHPEAGNIGGGGFMVIRLADGRVRTLDYRETAPARATRGCGRGPARTPRRLCRTPPPSASG